MYYKDSDMDINRNNYETSFLLYLDRELGPAEMLKVEKFLTENPDLQKEFVLLQQTIFLPEHIEFDQKELLFHKEEKRRVVPMYWVRIAASVIILLAAGWFVITKVTNNHQGELGVNNRDPLKIAPAHAKQVPVIRDLKNNNQSDRFVKKDIMENNKQANETGEKKFAKKATQLNQESEKGLPQKNNSITVPEQSSVAFQKSNAALEIQPDRVHTGNDPKQISALQTTQAEALVLVAAGSKDQIKVENSDLKEQNFKTDNAISIVALDDQNKSISGFFNKLTRHNPDDDKTNRKIRVSVFQLSY
jgi:hypothetical protein